MIMCVRLIEGQERFTWMTRVYYKDAHGCVIMFDLTNKNSFANTLKWKKDVDSKCTLPEGSPIPCMLLANKVFQFFIYSSFYFKEKNYFIELHNIKIACHHQQLIKCCLN